MSRKIHTYESDELIVAFEAKRCIHAEECVHGLPGAFDAKRRPWIDPTLADADEMARVIERCPTGALSYEWKSGAEGESGPAENTVRVAKDGPLYVRGRFLVQLSDGEVIEQTRAALCRCGHSKNKPFCDNAHIEAGFADEGAVAEDRLVPDEAAAAEALQVALADNGPLVIRGPIRVVGEGGGSTEGSRGVLCRCGQSESKPFCDGSHRRTGFVAD